MAEQPEYTPQELTEIDSELVLTIPEKVALGIPVTREEKIDYIFDFAVKGEKLLTEVAPQIGPMLESLSSNPMLKMFLR